MTRRTALASVLLILATTAVAAVVTPTAASAAISCDAATTAGTTWYDGPSAGYTYDNNFSQSHYIPWTGTDTPQGAATWINYDGLLTDVILITAYHDGENSYILAINAATGQFLGGVPIAPTHAGGIAVVGNWVYVGSGTTVRRYHAADIRSAIANGGGYSVVPYAGSQTVAAASFLGTYAGAVFAGKFDETARGYMDQYAVNADGSLSIVAGDHWEVPTKTQGVVVSGTHFLFSTSYGRQNRSNIYAVRRGYTGSLDNANLKCFRAPSMSEGMTQVGGYVYVVYESGSYLYSSDPATRNVIRNLHRTSYYWLTSLA